MKPVIPRFYVSDLARIANLHPYGSFLDLFQKYLYMDCDELFLLDVDNLGLTIRDHDLDDLEPLAKKEDIQILKSITDKADLSGSYKSSREAASSVSKIESIFTSIKSAARATNDSKLLAQVELLQEETKSKVRMRYGDTCESTVLDKYLDQVGFPVDRRNTQYLRWAVPADAAAHQDILQHFSASSSDECPLDYDAVRKCLSQQVSATTFDKVDLNPDPDTPEPGGSTNEKSSSSRSEKLECGSDNQLDNNTDPDVDVAFYIVGRPDGLSEQLDMAHSDARRWSTHTVVIEAKSRVSRISRPPPLYDQIQLTAYMLMAGCVVGDLVQSIRVDRDGDREVESEVKRAKKVATESATTTVDLTEDDGVASLHEEDAKVARLPAEEEEAGKADSDISQYTPENFDVYRLDFRVDTYRHGFHFFADVLPRLRVFRDAILALRVDDGLRYSWLDSLARQDLAAQAEIVKRLCPYVERPM